MEDIKCKSYFGDYKCHVKTNVKDSKGDFVYVDKCLKEAIENLNAVGLKTVASCCGHGIVNPKITIEGLSDGMDAPTSESGLNLDSVMQRVLKWWERLPDNMNGDVSKYQYAYRHFERHWMSLTYREIEKIYGIEHVA